MLRSAYGGRNEQPHRRTFASFAYHNLRDNWIFDRDKHMTDADRAMVALVRLFGCTDDAFNNIARKDYETVKAYIKQREEELDD